MTEEQAIVEKNMEVDVLPLADGLNRSVQVMKKLSELGFWKYLTVQAHIRRRASCYELVDLVAFLVAYFASGLKCGLKQFAAKTAGKTGKSLAALAHRTKWMTQSSVSRAAAAICELALKEMTAVFRTIWPQAKALHNLDTLGYRDAKGEYWNIFHFDGSVVAVRKRALPTSNDLPAAKRRASNIAAPGYTGRKRGEAVVQRGLTQAGHTSWWVNVSVGPGNGDLKLMAEKGVAEAVNYLEQTAMGRSQSVLVCDGGSGGWIPLHAALSMGMHGLTRLSNYGWLKNPDVLERMRQGVWYEVLDSGSGPKRAAIELGTWQEPDGKRLRLIVTRFAANEAKTKRGGAGYKMGEWHYEIFATTLPGDAWPASEVVTLYYGRCGQENQFNLLNKRYELERLFSYHSEGQELATLCALLDWNLELLLGAELMGPWDPKHPDLAQVAREDNVVAPPSDLTTGNSMGLPSEFEADEIEAEGSIAQRQSGKDGFSTKPNLVMTDSIKPEITVEAIFPQAIQTVLDNWLNKNSEWHLKNGHIICPCGRNMNLSFVKCNARYARLRMRASKSACNRCMHRAACTSSTSDKFRKEVIFKVAINEIKPSSLSELRGLLRAAASTGNSEFLLASKVSASLLAPLAVSESVAVPGPWACQHSRLSSAALLNAYDDYVRNYQYTVIFSAGTVAPVTKLPCAIVADASKRQHRRKSLAERIAWNALPSTYQVELVRLIPKTMLRAA